MIILEKLCDSLVLCKNRLLTHCAIVLLHQQIDLPANDDLEIKTEPLNWQTFCSKPPVCSAILEYSDNIYLNRCKFRFLELYFYHNESLEDWEESWRGQTRRKPHLPRRRSQKQRKQRRSSATDLRSLQIIRYEVLYLKTRLIIISFPNILLWHLFLALSKLDFFSKMPFPPSSSVFLRGCRHSSTPFWI